MEIFLFIVYLACYFTIASLLYCRLDQLENHKYFPKSMRGWVGCALFWPVSFIPFLIYYKYLISQNKKQVLDSEAETLLKRV